MSSEPCWMCGAGKEQDKLMKKVEKHLLNGGKITIVNTETGEETTMWTEPMKDDETK